MEFRAASLRWIALATSCGALLLPLAGCTQKKLGAKEPAEKTAKTQASAAPVKETATAKESVTLPNETITFSKHIAGILNKNCAECHRPNQVAPFSLLSYDDAKKRGDFINEITHDRRMPPYHADPNFGDFTNVRQLSETELALIDKWVKTGMAEGAKEDLPPTPKFNDGWKFGEPDLILKMPAPFDVPAQSRDIYQCFVIPTGVAEDKNIAAVEFRPGNRRVVHHAIMYLDDSGKGREKDAATKEQGYRSYGGIGFLPSGGLGGWAPGVEPRMLPDGFARFMKGGSDLCLQLHYHPSGKPETDQSEVGIYFAKAKPKHMITGIALFDHRINIAPGDADYRMQDETTLPCDVRAIAIWPHMHLLGREMKVVAITPDKQEIPLLWVKDWDFNWQDGYEYKNSPLLPKGTTIKLTARYDNSKDNPVNPNNPPKRVTFGEGTNDEMCLCTLIVYPDDPSDMRKLFTIKHARLGAALGGGALPEQSVNDRWMTILYNMRNKQREEEKQRAEQKK
jgi:mono/diheme cytochrome c family protein